MEERKYLLVVVVLVFGGGMAGRFEVGSMPCRGFSPRFGCCVRRCDGRIDAVLVVGNAVWRVEGD